MKLKKLLNLNKKVPISNLNEDVNTIKFYSSLGYNFVEVDTKLNKINDGAFDLLIEINREKELKYLQEIYWK